MLTAPLPLVLAPLLLPPPPAGEPRITAPQATSQDQEGADEELLEALATPRLTLPDGPAARAWAGVDGRTRPARLPEATATLAAPDPWSRPETWTLWADALRRAAAGGEPAALAQLALLARTQRRDEDAWQHFGRLVASPAHAAAVQPFLFPGRKLADLVLATQGDGTLPPLEPGAHLTPIAPPQPDDPRLAGYPGIMAWRDMSVQGLRIGGSQVDLKLAIESTGVQVDLLLRSGDPVALGVRMPWPAHHQMRLEYVDWERVEEVGRAHELLVGSVAEGHTLYGRVVERPVRTPGPVGSLPAQLEAAGLLLVIAEDDPEHGRYAKLAEELGSLAGVAVRTGPRPATGPGLGPLEIVVPGEPADRRNLERYLVSTLEQRLLASPGVRR